MEKKYMQPEIEVVETVMEQELMAVSGDYVDINGTASGDDALARELDDFFE